MQSGMTTPGNLLPWGKEVWGLLKIVSATFALIVLVIAGLMTIIAPQPLFLWIACMSTFVGTLYAVHRKDTLQPHGRWKDDNMSEEHYVSSATKVHIVESPFIHISSSEGCGIPITEGTQYIGFMPPLERLRIQVSSLSIEA